MNDSRIQAVITAERPPRRPAAVAGAVGFMALAGFQLALALGAPLGRAAWGGTYDQLPTGLRIASAFAVALWALAALVVLRRVGFGIFPVRPEIARRATWFLVGLLTVGALMNFASGSPWERFGWGPVALILAVLCFAVARGGWADARR